MYPLCNFFKFFINSPFRANRLSKSKPRKLILFKIFFNFSYFIRLLLKGRRMKKNHDTLQLTWKGDNLCRYHKLEYYSCIDTDIYIYTYIYPHSVFYI